MRNQTIKRALSITLCLMLLLATVPVLAAGDDAVKPNALHVVMPDATHGFLGESIRHAEDELQTLAAETGLAYELHKTADAGEQSACIEDAIQANAGAIVLWPITGEPLREAAQKVKDAGIPLIVYDRLIEGFTPDSEVLGDNMKIARMAGAYFNKYFPAEIAAGKKVSILELAGDDSTVPKQRTQGFMELAEKHVSVVKRFDTQWQREIAREHVENWLKTASVAEIESIQAIYSHEDEAVLGAMDAIAAYDGSAKLNIRLIIGLGGKRDLLMHMGYYREQFGIDLVTYQFSPAMIREAVQDGAKAAAGGTLAPEHLIDTFEIDRDTLSAYLASDSYQTRYTTAMPTVDNVPEDAWYAFAVKSRAIDLYTYIALGTFEPNVPVTADYASEVLAQTLPYSAPSESGVLTREKLAAMLMEALSGYGLNKAGDTAAFSDADKIGADYKTAVDYVTQTGLMRGLGGNRFDPQGIVTRAQLTTAMYNAVNACLISENSISEEAYNYFCELLKIPHGSDNEQEISDYLVQFAQNMGLEVLQDELLNVLIRKPGSQGRENEPPVILQGHMDMVCEKNEDVKHDFLKDPIIPVIDGDWVKANGTTLGSDNASGVSIIMAILASDTLSHPPIEALITTREETDMGGASGFDVSLLKGKRMINIDMEVEGVFTVSSASATNVTITIPVAYEAAPAQEAAYTLSVKGLTGGHSGLDIHKGRANANLLTAQLLNELTVEGIRVSGITGGSAKNAIPRECTAVILLPEGSADTVKAIIAKAETAFKAEYPGDEGMTIVFEKTDKPAKVMSASSLKNVLTGILEMPNGVAAMSEQIEGLVTTSSNLGVVETDTEEVTLTIFARSSIAPEEDSLLEEMKRATDNAGGVINIHKQTPPWAYQEKSPLREQMSAVFKTVYGKAPGIEAVHAGLECAAFAASMPDCDLISVGPDITGAHSPDEKMSLSSYNRVCYFVVEVLEALTP